MTRGYATPDEWLADTAYRRRYDYVPRAGKRRGKLVQMMPEPSQAFLAAWAEHKRKHEHTPRAVIEAALSAALAQAA
jgi:hypothetical protein